MYITIFEKQWCGTKNSAILLNSFHPNMAVGWGIAGCDRPPLLKFVTLFQKVKSKNNGKLAKTK